MSLVKHSRPLCLTPALVLASVVVCHDAAAAPLALDADWDLATTAGASATVAGTPAGSTTVSGATSNLLEASFTPASLTQVGDSLTLRFDLAVTQITGGNGSNFRFRFGLGLDDAVDDDGTWAQQNYARLNTNGAAFGSTTDRINYNATAAGPIMDVNGTVYNEASPLDIGVGTSTLALSITKTASGYDYVVSQTSGGVNTISVLDGAGFADFDSFAIGLYADGASGDAWTISNIVVDFTAVPEPASLTLLALGGLAVAGRRRG